MELELPHIEGEQNEHRINENTHTKIDFCYMSRVLFGKYYSGIIPDIFNILLAIVYFRTSNLTHTYNQRVVHNAIIGALFCYGISVLIVIIKVANAYRYYGQHLTEIQIKKKITFESNNTFVFIGVAFSVLFRVPSIFIMYYFVPFTKTTMCDTYGELNCNLMKAYCTYELGITSVLGLLLFFVFMLSPIYLKGIPKTITTFIVQNIFGLIFGNIMTTILNFVNTIENQHNNNANNNE